ncbi:DUF4350 domain-containing protein [Pedobacter sp. MW01-1-1]|uniref:DUF4350 domain-containing protein n=1 Tax=Pedobacter sp. MW01-1-1 TaxID=3383027 RepID=UPI003FEFDF7A
MKGYKLYIIIGSVFLLLYLVAQYNQPKPTDWSPSYSRKDKIPFGTYILYHRLQDIVPKAKIETSTTSARKTLSDQKKRNSSYVLIAEKPKISKADFAELKKFMQAGNRVFIAAEYYGDAIHNELNLVSSKKYQKVGLNFCNPNLKSEVDYGFKRNIGFHYFSKLDSNKTIVLGKKSAGAANFIQIPYGKGALFLMAEPGFFSNYNLLDKDGSEYAGKALSYLQGSQALIFDDYYSHIDEEEKDVFSVLFAHRELKCAYYVCLFALLIFVLYEIKRKQRVIPVVEPLANTSLEFVKVVGSVYYHERNNLDIATKRINYFLEHLRSRYYLATNLLDESFTELLVHKTGINEVFAKNLTRALRETPQRQSMNDSELILLNNSIEQFYTHTQAHGTRTI